MKELHVDTAGAVKAVHEYLHSNTKMPIVNQSTFKTWQQHPKYLCMCQGHFNAQQQLEGLAVRITPSKQIQIATYT